MYNNYQQVGEREVSLRGYDRTACANTLVYYIEPCQFIDGTDIGETCADDKQVDEWIESDSEALAAARRLSKVAAKPVKIDIYEQYDVNRYSSTSETITVRA